MFAKVTASRFVRMLSSGATKPCIAFAEDHEGKEVELVLKWKKTCGIRGLVCEAIASFLTDDLGIPSPTPFQVDVTQAFASAIPHQEISTIAQASVGSNFGSLKLSGQYATFPVNRPISLDLRPLAAEIFAFDSLIQNPDRQPKRPNCLHSGSEVMILDHDKAFSFLLPVIGAKSPWEAGGLDFMKQPFTKHLFYEGLSGTPANFARFAGAWEGITPARLDAYRAALPPDWVENSDAAGRIFDYIVELKGHIDEAISRTLEVLR